MKVTTKTGDDQTTFLKKRRPKDDLRVEVLGMVDELLAQLILTNIEIENNAFGFDHLIHHFNDLLAYLAMDDYPFSAEYVTFVEDFVVKHEWSFQDLNHFVQAKTREAAKINVLRTRVRTLERRFASLTKEESIDESVLIYLNRLSDYLFVSMLIANL